MSETTDFHVHCTEQTAHSVIDLADRRGIAVLGLVQRVALSPNITEFVEYGKSKGVRVLPGVEFVVALDDKRVDLIALGFNPDHPLADEHFNSNRRNEKNRVIAAGQLEFLQGQGFNFDNTDPKQTKLKQDLLQGLILEKAISWCRLAAQIEVNAPVIENLKNIFSTEWNEVVTKYTGKPGYETAQQLDAKFLWTTLFAPGRPGFVPVNNNVRVRELVEAVHQSGGIILYSPEGRFSEQTFQRLTIDYHIDGVYGWHGPDCDLTDEQIDYIESQGQLVLGGSDYDPEKNDWQIGIAKGGTEKSLQTVKQKLRY
jgi:hypothetical protein